MNQRKLVWRALKQAGLLESEDPHVQEFVQHLHNNPTRCWTDFVSDFRERYYDTFDKVIAALEGSNDPFIRNALIKFADPERPKEQQLLTKIANEADFEQDELAAKRLGRLKIRQIDTVLRRRMPATAKKTRARRRTSS